MTGISFLMFWLLASINRPFPSLTTPANTVIATIPVEPSPQSIAITPDSLHAYVVNTDSNLVTVIQLSTNLIVHKISGFNQPSAITIDSTGTFAYVTNAGFAPGSDTVSIVSLDSQSIVNTVYGFFHPTGLVITPDDKYLYVSNLITPPGASDPPNTIVSVVDLATAQISTTISVEQHTTDIAISPDGKLVYAINYNSGQPQQGSISIIDTTTNKVTGTIRGFSKPYGMAIVADGSLGYVTNFSTLNDTRTGGTISIINLEINEVVGVVTLSHPPTGIAITPNNNLLYVNTYYDHGPTGLARTKVIQVGSYQILPIIISVGNGPTAIAITPNGNTAVVANTRSNTISVITLISQTSKTIDAETEPA